MTTFRPCKSYPGYSVSRCGRVRRDAHAVNLKNGVVKVREARFVSRTTARPNHVALHPYGFVAVAKLIDDVWARAKDHRPAPAYADGWVITLAEYLAERASV